jgi:hypothetical protein
VVLTLATAVYFTTFNAPLRRSEFDNAPQWRLRTGFGKVTVRQSSTVTYVWAFFFRARSEKTRLHSRYWLQIAMGARKSMKLVVNGTRVFSSLIIFLSKELKES